MDQIIKAWTNRQFFESLSTKEKESLPANPAGLIDLSFLCAQTDGYGAMLDTQALSCSGCATSPQTCYTDLGSTCVACNTDHDWRAESSEL